jgi:hypothetical protein
VPVQAQRPAGRVQQAAPQCGLQHGEPEQRLLPRLARETGLMGGPAAFDLADPLDDHLVVMPVRPAVERQRQAPRGGAGRGEEDAVAAEIVEPRSRPAHCPQQTAQAG